MSATGWVTTGGGTRTTSALIVEGGEEGSVAGDTAALIVRVIYAIAYSEPTCSLFDHLHFIRSKRCERVGRGDSDGLVAVVGAVDGCDSGEGRLLGTGDDGQERTRRFH